MVWEMWYYGYIASYDRLRFTLINLKLKKNMLIRIFSLNGISDNLFFLSHVVLYLSCLFVPDNKVVTTRVCHRRGSFSKWSQETTDISGMIRKFAILVYLLLVRAMSFICYSGNFHCIKRTTAWPVDWANFC